MNVSLSKGMPRELKLMMLLTNAMVSVPPFLGLITSVVVLGGTDVEVVVLDVVVGGVVVVPGAQDISISEIITRKLNNRPRYFLFILPSSILSEYLLDHT